MKIKLRSIGLVVLMAILACFVGCATKPKPERMVYLKAISYPCSTNLMGDYEWQSAQVTEIAAPENSLVMMFGDSDLSKDIVKRSNDGTTIVRVHDGWVYRFYTNGGIESMTQLSNEPSVQKLQLH